MVTPSEQQPAYHWIQRNANGQRWASIESFAAARAVDASRLPLSVRILLEATLVALAKGQLEETHCEAILNWRPGTAGKADAFRCGAC